MTEIDNRLILDGKPSMDGRDVPFSIMERMKKSTLRPSGHSQLQIHNSKLSTLDGVLILVEI